MSAARTAAIIVAAGRGQRLGGEIPKQYQKLANGRAVLAETLRRFSARDDIAQIVLVIHPDDRALLDEYVSPPDTITVVMGADSRDGSARAGLQALDEGCARVLIHDGARPMVRDAVISGVLEALETHDGAAPALPVTDALWRVSGDMVDQSHPRDGLYRAQTPQGFRLEAIQAAFAAHRDGSAADEVEIARAHGLDVAVVEGDEDNLKLTRPGDFARADRIMGGAMDIRTGTGYDVHRFGPGEHVVLCGVKIAHGRGLKGHSDADVGMHALTDAIYGALARGDIGQHFPPSDPQWKGAESHIFLSHAVALAAEHGYRISNADCTLICEEPKIGPHAPAMRDVLAGIVGIDADRISVKATTSEQLGFTGRREGIAAQACVTLVRP